MSKTGPSPNPLAERLRARDKQETERYSNFLRRTRLQIETDLEGLNEAVAAKYHQAVERLAKMHAEQVENWTRSLSAERARIENSYRSGWDLLRRWWLRIFLVLALASSAIYLPVSGLARWDVSRIQQQANRIQEEIDRLTLSRDHLQSVLDNLHNETWGVTLGEPEDGQRYVALPSGAQMLEPIDGRISALVPPILPVE
ncbi:MAG: hypothetical protein OXG74_17735 [Acidobacteria bacterium]|nr:hypothetical protein [Acidobacteriota bacterium]